MLVTNRMNDDNKDQHSQIYEDFARSEREFGCEPLSAEELIESSSKMFQRHSDSLRIAAEALGKITRGEGNAREIAQIAIDDIFEKIQEK